MKGSTKSFPPDTFSVTNFQDNPKLQKKRLQNFRSTLPASVSKKGTAVNATQCYHVEIAVFLQFQLQLNRRSVISEIKLSVP